MIAERWLVPDEAPVPRTGSRAGRAAVQRRRGLRKRERYLFFMRFAVCLTFATFAIGFYLALAANVTRMNYELGKNAQKQAKLADESGRLEDEIARLSSRERLAAIGAKLGMHESDGFAQVVLPAEHQDAKAGGVAFLPWLK